jgi:hypothetical protein
VTVATETGRWPLDLLDVPVWQLLYVFHHLTVRDQRRQVMARAARVDMGVMTHMAFNDPTKLDDEIQSVRSAIDALDYEPVSDVAAQSKAQALLARLQAGRVLDPAALTPLVS